MKAADGLAELFALSQIRHDRIQTGSHDPRADARKYDTLVVQTGHQNSNATSFFPKHVLKRDFDILENKLCRIRSAHAQLIKMRTGGETDHLTLDDERRDAMRTRIWVRLGIDNKR